MANERSRDEFDVDLKSLQTYDAAPKTIERVRAHCLALLEAQRRPDPEHNRFPAAWHRWFEPATAMALSALYLAAAVSSTLALLQ